MLRVEITHGSVIDLMKGGTQLYHDDTAAATMNAMTQAALRHSKLEPADVVGSVVDQGGRPLVRAIVATSDPDRATLSDSTGHFEFRALPAKVTTVTVIAHGFKTLRFQLTLSADSTRRVGVVMSK